MNILVTGGCGFIGSFVVEQLVAEGHAVRVVDVLEPRVHGGKKPALPERVGFEHCMSSDTPEDWVQWAEAVIHLAAQVGVADSMADPTRYVWDNTGDTCRFLERLPGSLSRLVVASSMSVYGDGGPHVRESDPVNPTSVYALTKYDQERLCLMWGAQYEVPTTALRFFNVYGPGQALTNPYTGVLAIFAQHLLHEKPPTVYEDGQQTRDFVYVSDVASAVVRAATMTKPVTGVFNVCTGEPTTVLDAAMTLAQVMGKRILPTITHTKRPGDIRHCTGDPTKAKWELGISCPTTFGEGITEYAAWLKKQ